MSVKISDAEMAVMCHLWKNGEAKATDIAADVASAEGIDKNTAYTYIQRLVKKGYISRKNPGFLCSAAVSLEDVSRNIFRKYVNRLFDGSAPALIEMLVSCGEISPEEAKEISETIKRSK